MRFRRREWDVPMPGALVSYWTAWNESDLDRLGELLAAAVTEEVEWNDPRDSFVGRSELEAAIRRLRTGKPEYRFVIASEIDHHHGRLRYRWDMVRNGRTLMEGLDVVTLEPGSQLISRVDGFFGQPTPIDDESGVPASLRAVPLPKDDTVLHVVSTEPLVLVADIASADDVAVARAALAAHHDGVEFIGVVAGRDEAELQRILEVFRPHLAEVIFTTASGRGDLAGTDAAWLALDRFGMGQDFVFTVPVLADAVRYAVDRLTTEDRDRWEGTAVLVLSASPVDGSGAQSGPA